MSGRNSSLLFIAAILAVSGSTSRAMVAAPLPTFEDFKVKEIFKGKPAEPRLSTPEARRFRTQLRVQAARGPNFAGHFTMALWGCGAGCVAAAVIDSITGEVYFAPFEFEDGPLTLDGDRASIKCHHASDFHLDSELYVFQGSILQGANEGPSGTYYYRWYDRRFSLLHYAPACPALQG